jgi:hypothetical protein
MLFGSKTYKNVNFSINKKVYNFLFFKYQIAWQRLMKITYLKYFKPINLIINFKKLNNF